MRVEGGRKTKYGGEEVLPGNADYGTIRRERAKDEHPVRREPFDLNQIETDKTGKKKSDSLCLLRLVGSGWIRGPRRLGTMLVVRSL